MTESQEKRAKEIVNRRKELEARGNLMELLLDFWYEANEDYEFGNSHITSISCNDGVWTFFDEKQGEEMSDITSESVLGECFKKIRNVPYSEISSLMGDQSELMRIGFTVKIYIDAKKFVMKI